MIRPARPGEAALLTELALRSKAVWGYDAAFMERCREELTVRAEDTPDMLVLETNEGVVGFYSLQVLSPERVELGHLFVEPAHLGRGHGRALLGDAILRARRRGHQVLVIQGDPHAERFYRAAGAERVGERESESIPGRMLPTFEIGL